MPTPRAFLPGAALRAVLRACFPAVLPVLLLAGCGGAPERALASEQDPGPPRARPNLVVIVVDDLRWDELAITGHPYVETPNIDRLAREGAIFTRAFHSVPLCSPNRATLLTGQYPSRHGIIDNVSRALASHRLQTFPRALQGAGYDTAFLGKWHMGNDPTPRPGFDLWVAIPGQGRSTDPELYESGGIHVVRGYLTDILTDRALSFIERPREGPFLLYLAHKAIHPDIQQRDDGSADPTTSLGYVAAPRHRGRYAGEVFPLRPNVVGSPAEIEGKPALRRALERKHATSSEQLAVSQQVIRDRAEMLLAVDDSVGRLIATLEANGELDDTVIVLTSDNGFFFGEHALTVERRLPYEESIRTPLLVRYPPAVAPGTSIAALVGSVDLAPTLLELAGAPIGDHVQGRSLVPLLSAAAPAEDRAPRAPGGASPPPWRDAILIEFYTYENPFPWLLDMDYRALRTARYKYVHWMQHPDENELYDLEADPYETQNLIDDPSAAALRAELEAKLARGVLEASGLTPAD